MEGEVAVGPKRVVPGKLSVSRALGDPVSKLPFYGGKPGVVTAVPDIRAFKVQADYDFVVLGSDGVYDTMSNKDVARCVISTMQKCKGEKSIHELCAASVESIIKNSLMRKTRDNVSVVMVAFKHLEEVMDRCEEVEKSIEVLDKSKMMSADEASDYKGLIMKKKIQGLSTY